MTKPWVQRVSETHAMFTHALDATLATAETGRSLAIAWLNNNRKTKLAPAYPDRDWLAPRCSRLWKGWLGLQELGVRARGFSHF